MSIERIEELKKILECEHEEQNGFVRFMTHNDRLVIVIADYLIEQHEEKETIKCDMNEGLYNNYPVVEVGQVRRWDKKYEWGRTFEVVGVVSDIVKTQYADEKGTRTFRLTEVKDNTELVTMENIEPGEWVEALTEGSNRRIGGKYIVCENGLHFLIKCSDGDSFGSNRRHFKPCLPPVEEQPKPLYQHDDNRTYTKEEVIAIADKNFAEGRKSMRKMLVDNQGLKYSQEELDKACLETKQYWKDKMEQSKKSFRGKINKLEMQLKTAENTFKQRHKNELEAEKCKAYKEGYDIGHKYGYERAIEILQLQNH